MLRRFDLRAQIDNVKYNNIVKDSHAGGLGRGGGGSAADYAKVGEHEMTFFAMLLLLKPYFWPKGWQNRARVVSTYFLLGISKGSNIFGPLFIGAAVQHLVDAADGTGENTVPYRPISLYVGLAFASVAFREAQRVVYLKVGQIAYAQLAELSFRHLHSLSMEWHLKKKMGHILRAMDRGINSANSVVTYLFLNLAPTIAEALVVFIIFYFQFNEPWLSVIAFVFLTAYIVLTITMTLWRKKFRAKTNKHDNAFHDKAVDSLVNFETVKYFANEEFEVSRYIESVEKFQSASVQVR
jgi:ABC-type multidrug transport system fused ATPase/permease subunit